ncbi:hypothetical protein CBS101457_003979 [Exobasidium rhododendri]|nr:hypothetical protein CBS101457_003979 [Exobasidium rhododendri]
MTQGTAGSSTELPPVVIIGAGLSGLVAAYEITQAGRKVIIVDQEPDNYIGGQAHWSLGGLFFVNSPEQRRLGIKDSKELALRDWLNSAKFEDTSEGGSDFWGRKWAEGFINFASDEFRDYVGKLGLWCMPNVGWAERGDGQANGHGNSVPRFHLAWGTGPEVVRIFKEPVLEAAKKGLVEFRWRHRVDELIVDEHGKAVGVKGAILEQVKNEIGQETTRNQIDSFEVRGRAVVIASGGIGGNVDLIRKMWPEKRMGPFPKRIVVGVPAHVDGRMLQIADDAGANLVNQDRMWHYTEGLQNWDPIWPMHGIRVIPGPTSLWLDAVGKRLPPPYFPGCDTLGTLKAILNTGYEHTWFILDQHTIGKEFALSGSEQNPDVTGKDFWLLLQRLNGKGPEPVRNFQKHGKDFVTKDSLRDLVDGMNEIMTKEGGPKVQYDQVYREIQDRDSQVNHVYAKDAQIMLINNARSFWPDRYTRIAKNHTLLDPKSKEPRANPAYGPLIAVRLNILTRKTLGGIQTNTEGQVMSKSSNSSIFPGLYAAGEVNGFGGGGVHGFNALEGTFLGGCIFSGRAVGRTLASVE